MEKQASAASNAVPAQLASDSLTQGAEAGLSWENTADGNNIVDWDGPGDAANPLNWPKRKSFGHVVIVAVLSMVV
jgi:hypothetical protein